MLGIRLKILALIAIFVLMALVVSLVRKKKLKEEYAFLWIMISLVSIVLILWFRVVIFFTNLFGILSPNNTIFFFAILFLVVICLHFSVKISTLTSQVKILIQENALLQNKLEKIKNKMEALF